jgi:hypothetical protein
MELRKQIDIQERQEQTARISNGRKERGTDREIGGLAALA